MIGTSRYPNQQVMLEAVKASGAEIVTVAVRRVSMESGGEGLFEILGDKYHFLPNTAGCFTARDAVVTAELAREAAGICRDTGMGFCGPGVLGVLALASESIEDRDKALAEGQAILDKGCLGHNFYWFHRDAMEAYLESRDWDGAERHAEALATFMAEDPLPYAVFYIERARYCGDRQQPQ